jgi:hypothetical protein
MWDDWYYCKYHKYVSADSPKPNFQAWVRYDRKLWIGDFLKSVVYLPFEQSNGKPTLARRREGDTDGKDTSA